MFNVTHIVQSGGLLLLAVFLFAEVGLFLGFFLPGDTLLIAAGIYAKQGRLDIAAVIAVGALAAMAGDSTSYLIGRHLGRRLFRKDDGLIFRQDHVQRAEAFYDKHGPKTLLVSHFLPVIRTFSPPLAGVARMYYPRFLSFNVIGDALWATSVSLVGYYVGSRIPNADHYILLAIIGVIIVSAGPALYQFAKISIQKRRQADD
jgi:membrane-associated protein